MVPSTSMLTEIPIILFHDKGHFTDVYLNLSLHDKIYEILSSFLFTVYCARIFYNVFTYIYLYFMTDLLSSVSFCLSVSIYPFTQSSSFVITFSFSISRMHGELCIQESLRKK